MNEDKFYKIPNLLELMLAYDEKNRKNIIEICMICD